MKKLKISLSMFAIVLGLGLSAFTAKPVKANAKFSTAWFVYNGSGNVDDPANYTEVSGTPSCPGSTSLCSINATVGSNSQPVMTQSLENEISTAISTNNPSAHVKLLD
jgi:hypothetical protein